MEDKSHKFDLMADKLTQSFTDTINLRSKTLNLQLEAFNVAANNKIQEKCLIHFEKLLEISHSQFKQETSTLVLSSKTGFEKEYKTISKDIIDCVLPYKKEMDKVSVHSEMFEKLTNLSYNNCINSCKNLFKSKQPFKEIKSCLVDCFNLSKSNFDAYERLAESTIKRSEENINRL